MAITIAAGNGFIVSAYAHDATLSFVNPITAGSLLVAMIQFNSTTETPAFSDSTNGSWTVITKAISTDFGASVAIAYFVNSAGGVTPTVTLSGIASQCRWSITEYKGVDTSSPFDGTHNAKVSGVSHSPSSGNITTTANGMIIATAQVYNTVSPTPNTGYTTGWSQTSSYDYENIYNLGATTGTQAAGWSTTETYSLVMAAAFKEAAGGGGTNFPLTASPGSLSFTGGTATTKVARVLTANPSALNFTGVNATVKAARFLTASPGALVFTGGTGTFRTGKNLIANPSSMTFSGGTATFRLARTMPATPRALTFTGSNANLVYTPAGGGGNTVNILSGVSAYDDHGGVSKKIIKLTSLGGNQYTVTYESGVSENKVDSVHNEWYIIT